jgi:DeoR family fructose operon transcriptional repressor
MKMFTEERRQLISEMLSQKSRIKVSEISELLNVSESTIRRDLKEMEEMGLLSRTHGGAVSFSVTNFEPTYNEKESSNQEEKNSIGKAAASMIKDGDTIVIDSGTTTLEIAKNIAAKNISVITNSIDIASILCQKENVEVILTGGSLRPNTRAMVGQIAENAIKNFRVDKAFIGANGISAEAGLTTPNYTEAQTKKAMIDIANKVIIVVDSTKFNRVNLAVISPVSEITTIITSSAADKKVLKEYEALGIELKVAD